MAAINCHQSVYVFVTTFFVAAAIVLVPTTCTAQLTSDFYKQSCPQALQIIRSVVQRAINREARMGASLLRLHFHDCFVNGCDGSILLDDTDSFTGEKTAGPNLNSVRGFDVVDDIKAALNRDCYGNVVSCADILAVAARDSVEILGGPSYSYEVQLGRRDATTAVLDDANRNLPAPTFDFSQLLSIFQSHGLGLQDLILLSGGHTIGLARCTTFRARIYNDTNIDSEFAASLQKGCPANGGDDNTAPIDSTTTHFDTVYFKSLLQKKGLFHSDQELFKSDGSDSDNLVQHYANSPQDFKEDFGASMVKMGNIKPLTGSDGEIRLNCRKIN
ncbi:PREDICTED: peroxidase P7-like [Prunus mume]|uniref:Peroxidase n=1 Tax=Prunus mume TaxID=102107 RepID=A0ABM0P8Q1_PRUMU|nr:PREDICTED: peroxidase P7-like [Prunus mume]